MCIPLAVGASSPATLRRMAAPGDHGWTGPALPTHAREYVFG